MANLSNAIENRKKTIKAMEDANNAQVVNLDPLKAMAVLADNAYRSDDGAENALLAAAILDNPHPKKANAIGYSAAKSYTYSNGFYGRFETDEQKDQETPVIVVEVPAEEKKGLKEYWDEYKYYVISLLIIIAAIVAYKKL